MTRFDDLDRALEAYFDGETVAPAPTGLLELVAAATSRHRPRTTWLARVRERGLQPTGDRRQATHRRPVSRGVLLMVGLVVLALLAAVVVVGSRWIDERRQPSPIELPGGWTAVPPHPNGGDALALLKDGRVLFIGGPAYTAGDIFDPKTNAFVGIGPFDGTGPMSQPREFPSATTLLDGRVLVVGGQTPDGVDLATAELFDPTTGTFSPTGSMALAISGPAATLLPDGRVLIIGWTPAG
jgi:Kelch motif